MAEDELARVELRAVGGQEDHPHARDDQNLGHNFTGLRREVNAGVIEHEGVALPQPPRLDEPDNRAHEVVLGVVVARWWWQPARCRLRGIQACHLRAHVESGMPRRDRTDNKKHIPDQSEADALAEVVPCK